MMMDPILTPLLVSGLVAAGMTAGGAAILAPILSFVIVTGVAVGLYLLTAPSLPEAEDGKISVKETVPPRNYAYGRCRLSGALMLRETNNAGGNLGTVLALVSHEVKGFAKIFLNDDPCTFGGADFPATPDPDGFFVDAQEDGRYGNNVVVIAARNGVVPETHMSMFSTYGFSTVRWPSTARGDGIAQLGMICRDAGQDEQQKRFPYGAPNPSAVCDTAFVYDPRDSAQDPDDPSTWLFSRNPALAIIHFLCFSEFGFRYKYDEAIDPPGAPEVLDAWKHAADVCDETVDTAAGDNINRYELGGFATTDNNPKETVQTMLATCDGWLCRRGDGSCVLTVGKFEPDGTTITDEDILGFSIQKGVGDDEAVNRLDVQLTSQDHDWTQIECDPWDDNQDQIERGHVRETVDDLKWVQDYRRARRLAKREFYRVREPVRGTLELRLSAINAAYTRWIYVQSNLIPSLNNHYIENRLARYELAGSPPKIHMEFLRIDSEALENWGIPRDLETESQALQRDEGRKPPDMVHSGEHSPIPTLEGLVVTKETYKGTDVLKFEWDAEPFVAFSLKYDIRYRVEDTPPGVWRNETIDDSDAIDALPRRYVYSRALPNPTFEFEGEVRIRLGNGSVGDWSVSDSTAS